MSADSGLKTYGEVSDLDWFAKNNLTYRDLANPDLLVKNPDWFYAYLFILFSFSSLEMGCLMCKHVQGSITT